MKHAYLILAHNEFEVLNYLITALDHEDNDIYIHFDKKVSDIPLINYTKSRVFILEERVDVRWGDVSMIEAELNLFRTARGVRGYQYYHLLSGVDFPLKTQEYIHEFFKVNNGFEFIGYSQGDLDKELCRKICYYHLFPKEFKDNKNFKSFLIRGIRSLFISIQRLINFKRYNLKHLKKGPQWVSVSDGFVGFLLSQQKEILKKYKYTFCSDEVYIQTICWNSAFKERIYNLSNSIEGCKREIKWKSNNIENWTQKDIPYLLSSGSLFARKFNFKSIPIIEEIINTIN